VWDGVAVAQAAVRNLPYRVTVRLGHTAHISYLRINGL